MRSETGMTLVEMVAALGLVAALTGAAVFAGGSLYRSAQYARAATRLVDDIAIARMNAVGRHNLWRIYFEPPATPASTASPRFHLEYCSPPSCANWERFSTFEPGHGLGFRLDKTGGEFASLQFNKDGFYAGATRDIDICRLAQGGGEKVACQTETDGRRVTIHAITGVVEY